jgi:NIPSNAP
MTAGAMKQPEAGDDPFCELRIYRVAAGRAADMEARVQGDLRTLFPKHGIRPLAGWSTVVSPVSPAFIYLTPWTNMNQRSASWAGFYSDPEWAEVRGRTNGNSELVESYEIMFLRAITAWQGQVEVSAFSELIIQTCAIGKTMAVTAELNQHTIPILAEEGARVHGVFDMMSGRPLPSLVFLVGWDSLDQRSAALARLDLRSQANRAAGNPVLLDRAEQHLMRHVAVDWA